MSSHIEVNRQFSSASGNQSVFAASISKKLFETPPRSQFFPLRLALTICHFFLVFISKFVLGQFFITMFDSLVIKLEKTLDFCVPHVITNAGNIIEHRDVLPSTDRPMSWILFLPSLILLRFFRFWASVVSIMLGRGEITAKQMRIKIFEFRRYYSSVRHYAVKKFSPDELALMRTRCASSVWSLIYNIDAKIFMRKAPNYEILNMYNKKMPIQKMNKSVRARSCESLKNSLNEIDDDLTDVEDSRTHQMLEEFLKLNDLSADHDYDPEEEPLRENLSSDDGVKTESLKQLNDSANLSSKLSGNRSSSPNGYASDNESRIRRKKEPGVMLDDNRILELENQLVQKIISHFKTNLNYSPTSVAVDEVFYSPFGSPPDKGSEFDIKTQSFP